MYTYRRLTFISSATALIISLTTLILVQACLPKSTSEVAHHIFFYAAFSAVVSGVGLIGARRRHATLLTIYANYLLLDAVVFTIPRLLFLVYTITLPNTICGHTSSIIIPDQVAFRSSPAYLIQHPRQLDRLEGWARRVTNLNHGQCLGVSGTLEGLFVVAVIGLTVAEWWCALKARRYAMSLSQEEELSEKKDDEHSGHRRSSSSSSTSSLIAFSPV
ncbi:hypothetical protein NA57DRAFT_54499 [Rhizodiscina lignyota]|uniref:Uncharacterized protein n=1 Tax=Rhizodiscina lignyota TaxID=1504668 RepID=A0A9P4IG83_9PEZI|nr:hypothetical protein NA57DRAFT_54499 [Rhizodiscina lignyota]